VGFREAQGHIVTSRKLLSTALMYIRGQWPEEAAAIEDGYVEATPQGTAGSLHVGQAKASRAPHKEAIGDLKGDSWGWGRGVQMPIN
jgi:hypothetical protein